MDSISIADRLWFDETLLGATLNYRSNDVLFRVGISLKSLEDCNNALAKATCLWTIRDGSLSIYGDLEQLSLTFCSVQGSFVQSAISLYGEELRLFKYAVNALVARRKIACN